MAIKKYADEKAIKEKIHLLFTYRKLTDLLHESQLDKDKQFKAHLIEIQYQIYLLDAYLEGQWVLDKNKLTSYWQAIKTSLSTLHYSDQQIKILLHEIKDYERIESNCRKDRWPTKETFKTFYTTKSCDVRLIRHLIYNAHPALNDLWKEKAWSYYDHITEINDDIADIREDLQSYNGNRFLISILRKGQQKSTKQYRDYLRNVTSKAKNYFKDRLGEGKNQQLYDWTVSRSKETLELLDQTTETTDHTLYSTSLLLGQMK